MKEGIKRIFHCNPGGGCSKLVSDDPARVTASKKPIKVSVKFALSPIVIETLEGPVLASGGDAIITGTQGERWPVGRERFLKKYLPLGPTAKGGDGFYQSAPNTVIALKIEEPFAVVLPDGVSILTGKPGDWLMDYGDGSLGVVDDQVFIETYSV